MPLRKLRIASSCCLTQSLLSRSQATTSSAPSLMSSPTPPRLPNSASVNSHASPAAISTTPIRLAATASPRGTPRLVAQPISGSSCVLTSAATISGTVAARAYQIAPPTSNTPAVISSALALQRAIALPAAARAGTSADMGGASTRWGAMVQPGRGAGGGIAWRSGRRRFRPVTLSVPVRGREVPRPPRRPLCRGLGSSPPHRTTSSSSNAARLTIALHGKRERVRQHPCRWGPGSDMLRACGWQ